MYVEILCPRCLAAVSGRTLRDRSPRPRPEAPVVSLSAGDVIETESEDDSLTETDIVEAELTVADDPPKTD
jgi:hypothetical protein